MGLDIRWPIGLMFSFIGLLLTGYGAVAGFKVDLWWGLGLLVFGMLMLFGATRGRNHPPSA
jgi:hypothetical protein